ncbi:MAG: Phenylacetic acid catabolic protein, partial [Saprospiraceae bacterium]|nr:Phenylacetic acid catabolic protein [Saprospiraceae bacterium]
GLDLIPDWTTLAPQWKSRVQNVMQQATIPVPEDQWMQSGGKEGLHTEHLGYILTELQYLQRTYPAAQW